MAKLLVETITDTQYLTEGEGDNKTHYIKGIFLQSELKNQNGRVYPRTVLEKECRRYNEEYVSQGRALGELSHPQGPAINLDRVSHIITELYQDGNNFIGKAKLLDTPLGKVAKNLIEGGAKLGVSSRGVGTLKNQSGYQVVQDDYKLATAADIVANPSAPDAWVSSILESKEWVWDNGIWSESKIDEVAKIIKTTPKVDLEKTALRLFENFINGLVPRKTK